MKGASLAAGALMVVGIVGLYFQHALLGGSPVAIAVQIAARAKDGALPQDEPEERGTLDAERERQHGDTREARRAAEPPQREPRVLAKISPHRRNQTRARV
jgi:hypothetical protein